jgi:hypothetical protein
MSDRDEIERIEALTESAQLQAKEKEVLERAQNETRMKRPRLPAEQSRVYREALTVLNRSGLRYAVGAAFARYVYTSIWRQTKDLDVFVRPEDLREAMNVLEEAGFATEVKEKNWLAKAWKDGSFLDIIFGTGHGQLPIDDRSFEGTVQEKVLGIETYLIPIEEMIASAAFVAGRNRFDGPEVVHLIRAVEGKLNWERILERMGDNRELLLWHLILFDFVYPGHSKYLPQELMAQLFAEIQKRWEKPARNKKAFRGTLLDPFSYKVDVEDWRYEDRRNKDPLVDKQGKAL